MLDFIIGVPPKPTKARRNAAFVPKQKVESWQIVARIENYREKHDQYMCRCVCGKTKPVLGMHLRSKRSRSCGCKRSAGRKHYKWTGHGEISGGYWGQIRHGASIRKGRSYELDFEISIEYAWALFLKQDRRCALTGLPLTISRKRTEHTASLDRIDSTIGYVAGNVQWVNKEINMMKRTMSQDRFVSLCKAVAAHKC